MKKRIKFVLVVALLTCLFVSTTAEAATKTIMLKIGNPSMTVNGSAQEIDPGRGTVPIVIASRTLIPIRTIVEQMGGSIAWNQAQQLVTIVLEERTVRITISSVTAQVQDAGVSSTWTNKPLDVPARLVGGRTMIPLRFVSETLGATVDYEGTTRTITINFTPVVSTATDWSGTWDTNWGTMTLVQVGNSVTGSYTHDSGKISGTVSGNKLIGTWSESPSYSAPNDAGDIEFTLYSNKTGFSGSWRYGSSGGWSGSWYGTKM